MTQAPANKWALEHYKPLTEEVILTLYDELQAHFAGKGRQRFNRNEVYALASKFRDILYRYPYFKKKPLRILWALVDRCGEAYYKRDPTKLYIPEAVVMEWSADFHIPLDRIKEYIDPLLLYRILVNSDNPSYAYKVGDEFFQLVGPIAQHLVKPVDPNQFSDVIGIVGGVVAVYIIATSVKLQKQVGVKPLIPWVLKLPMIYTLTGLDPQSKIGSVRIRPVLDTQTIDAVDKYLVVERGIPVELYRSIRTEAFSYMASNRILENGYVWNGLWRRLHEIGVERYLWRVVERRLKRGIM